MKIIVNIVGVLLILLGSVWILQGMNVLLGSPMTGQTRWAVRGGILVVAGIVGLFLANRKRQGAA
jgi:hypothetical protein